ncbi:DUF4129 domain-containing protein [Gracilibacillus alcaliphilus]|uniref:DUF4129 domain-containing protein n=1 Tax=Gracilibacillus alcaliphilus TaxID=1401441 RepID=UPI00195935A2|nr:DUF4129 domain-containing protein [Gracilibacillus alcaliphilus]MBM7677785.1 hypothetical protein [Gracilibacillus alcaliphilus]
MTYAQHEQEQLEEILSSREYQIYYEDHRSLLERAWDRIRDWINENILEKILSQFDSTSNTGNIVVSIILFILALLILLGIIALVMTFVRKRKLRHYRPLSQEAELDWGYPEHLQAAQQYELEGEYTKASRHHFLALLLCLNQKGWLQAQQWKTNLEYYLELKKGDPETAKQFHQFAVFFEKVMYGEHAITPIDYQAFKQEINSLIESVSSQPQMKETGER